MALLGRLVKDPELKTLATATICNFTIAVDRRFTKQGEEKQADFFSVKAWGKTGEFVSKYFTKGVRILVSGRIENRSWTDNDGNKKYATDIIAEEVYFADGKKDNNVNNNDAGDFFGNYSNDDLPF